MEEQASWFTSKRELILWLLAGSVVVAIYATLGLATALADELTNRDLLDDVAAIAFVMLFTVVLTIGLKGRVPAFFPIATAVGLVAVYLLVFLRIASPIERSHLIEYSLLAILIHEALLERRRNGRAVSRPGVLAVGLASSLGVVDELIQLFIPGRVFDPIDIVFNVFAAVMGVAVSATVAWAVRRRQPGS